MREEEGGGGERGDIWFSAFFLLLFSLGPQPMEWWEILPQLGLLFLPLAGRVFALTTQSGNPLADMPSDPRSCHIDN